MESLSDIEKKIRAYIFLAGPFFVFLLRLTAYKLFAILFDHFYRLMLDLPLY
jgi:hypothetical protein